MVGNGIVLGLLSLSPSAPPARNTTPPAPPVTPADATVYAANVMAVARIVRDRCARETGLRDLVTAAVTGLYAAVREPVPADLAESFTRPQSEASYQELLTKARVSLGDRPTLAGQRAYVLSVEALSRAADPYCGLALERRTSVASTDPEFGLGFELEGATGNMWLVYYLELAGVGGRAAAEKAKQLPHPPLPAPWRVKCVYPGSPAAAAGLRAGDRITSFNGREVTAATNARAVADLLFQTDRHLDPRPPAEDGKPPRIPIVVSAPTSRTRFE